jgi:hypothetical protein
MCGRSRKGLYRVLWTGRVNEGLAMVLMPSSVAVERGELKFHRTSARGIEPNVWRCDSQRHCAPL